MFINKQSTVKNILVSLVLCSIVMPSFAGEEKVLQDQCYLSKIKNSRIGYRCTSQKLVNDKNEDIIITKKHSEQQFQRFGFEVKLTNDFKYVENKDGSPKSYSAKINTPNKSVDIEAKFLSPYLVEVTTTQNGNSTTKKVELDRDVIFPYAISQLIAKNTDNSYFRYSTVDANADFRIITLDYVKEEDESLSSDNLFDNYNKFKVSIDLLPNIGNYEWYDDKGTLVKEWSSLLDVENIAVTKDEAINNQNSNDVFYQSLIPIDSKIYKPFSLDKITYKITTQNSNPSMLFVTDDRQRIIQTKDDIAYLKIKNEQYNSNSKYNYPVKTKGYKKYLKSGPYINLEETSITETANKLSLDKKNAYKAAKSAEKWVFENIEENKLSLKLKKSSSVLKEKSGDIKERSILLASILRSMNIPSKIVVGLVYSDVPESAFSYHMWVKAYVGDWINLDPSKPSDIFSPIHIALAESSMNNVADDKKLVGDIIESLSNYQITVLNYDVLKDVINEVDISKNEENSDKAKPLKEFSLLKFIKNNENFVKKITLKNGESEKIKEIELGHKKDSDSIRSAYYNYTNGNIEQAIKDFEKGLKQIPFNDDFAQIQYSKRLASLGLFTLADSRLNNVYDGDIWKKQVTTIKNLYYPSAQLGIDDEILFAHAISKIDYQHNADEAIKLLKDKDKEFYKNSDYANYLLAEAYVANEHYDKALPYIKTAISINPDNYTYRFEKAKILAGLKKYSPALSEINKLYDAKIADENFNQRLDIVQAKIKAERSKKVSQYGFFMALSNYYKGEYQNAIDILNSIVKTNKNQVSAYTLLGDANFEIGNMEEAVSNYKIAIKLKNNNIFAIKGLAKVEQFYGEYTKALKLYSRAQKIHDKNEEVMISMAECLKSLSRDKEAYSMYEKVLKRNENNYIANHNMGLKYMSTGEYKNAQKYFKKSLSINPLYTTSWIEMARIQIKRKNYFMAKTYLSPLKYIDHENADFYYLSGLLEKYQDNFVKAKQNFKKAIEINPGHKEALQGLEAFK